ncbi:hypothetical protein WAI453_002531 [Rhynchosporium graminicola]
MIIDTLTSGGDPKDIAQEILACYGSTTTKLGIQSHMIRDIIPNVKLIQEARRQGGDPKDVVLIEGVRSGNPGKGRGQICCTIHNSFPFLSSLSS